VGRQFGPFEQRSPLSRVARAEPAAGLGDRVTEYERADQPFDTRDLSGGHPGVEQGLVDDVDDHDGARRGRGPGEQQRSDGRVPVRDLPRGASQRAQPLWPGPGRIGPGQFGEQVVDEPVEQVILAADVRVERHRGDPDPGRDRPHGDRVQPLFVGDGQRRVKNLPPPVGCLLQPPIGCLLRPPIGRCPVRVRQRFPPVPFSGPESLASSARRLYTVDLYVVDHKKASFGWTSTA
jgi:hypothetical protein